MYGVKLLPAPGITKVNTGVWGSRIGGPKGLETAPRFLSATVPVSR